jgi:hypothetical protein
MTRIRGERWAALAGLAFVVLYVTAFTLGIEVGASDREISTTTQTAATAQARSSPSS